MGFYDRKDQQRRLGEANPRTQRVYNREAREAACDQCDVTLVRSPSPAMGDDFNDGSGDCVRQGLTREPDRSNPALVVSGTRPGHYEAYLAERV